MATRVATIVSGLGLILINLALICSLADAGKVEDVVRESSGGILPFLQFTNDGVRLNFGGYHAEAGLGGILGENGKAGGGLHASAGTPFGPQASAGLGGLLNGGNANTGGGLYAQAGLGDDRPSAKAGLGGILDGSGRWNYYPAAGNIFAGADLGNDRPSARAGLGGILDGNGGSNRPATAGTLFANADLGNDRPSAVAGLGGTLNGNSDNAVSANPSPAGHTNIQIISKSATGGHKNQRAIATKSILTNEAVPESKYSSSQGFYDHLYAGANVADLAGQTGPEGARKIPPVSSPPPGANNVDASLGVVAAGNNLNAAPREPPIADRWYLRKRLRSGIPKKEVITGPEISSAIGSGTDSVGSTGKVVSRVNIADPGNGGVAYVSSKTYKPGSLFDDIFNIPISTLTAVNQLLRNNAG